MLGLKSRTSQYCEKGKRNCEKLESPKAIMFACYVVTLGVDSYSGPEPDKKIEANRFAFARLFNL